MEWVNLILAAIGGSVTSVVGSIFYFRPKLKELQAGASKAQTEADDARLNYLMQRIESSEKLYTEQGKALDDLRKKQLQLETELHEKNKRITLVETENRALNEKISALESENKTLSEMVNQLVVRSERSKTRSNGKA